MKACKSSTSTARKLPTPGWRSSELPALVHSACQDQDHGSGLSRRTFAKDSLMQLDLQRTPVSRETVKAWREPSLIAKQCSKKR